MMNNHSQKHRLPTRPNNNEEKSIYLYTELLKKDTSKKLRTRELNGLPPWNGQLQYN